MFSVQNEDEFQFLNPEKWDGAWFEENLVSASWELCVPPHYQNSENQLNSEISLNTQEAVFNFDQKNGDPIEGIFTPANENPIEDWLQAAPGLELGWARSSLFGEVFTHYSKNPTIGSNFDKIKLGIHGSHNCEVFNYMSKEELKEGQTDGDTPTRDDELRTRARLREEQDFLNAGVMKNDTTRDKEPPLKEGDINKFLISSMPNPTSKDFEYLWSIKSFIRYTFRSRSLSHKLDL